LGDVSPLVVVDATRISAGPERTPPPLSQKKAVHTHIKIGPEESDVSTNWFLIKKRQRLLAACHTVLLLDILVVVLALLSL
jgi:hypothetical protein